MRTHPTLPERDNAAAALPRRPRRGLLSELALRPSLYLMVLPGVLFFLIFNYLPMVGLGIAFVDYSPIAPFFGLGSRFVGLENFRFFFTSNEWIRVTLNTFYLNALFISSGLIAQMLLAVGLSETRLQGLKRVSQTLMFLPNFISWTVVSVFSIALFSTKEGLINKLLLMFGGKAVNFYQTASVWPGLLVALRLWKGAGFGTVIYLSTIAGISHEVYEAATIDGASRMGRVRYVTLPLLKTTTAILLIMSIGGIFSGDFGMIYALIGDNPMLRTTTDVIDTYVYRALRLNNDYGMSAAVGLFQSIMGFVFVVCANAVAKKLDPDSALF
jgi:putative aldouronate transport system permease protein